MILLKRHSFGLAGLLAAAWLTSACQFGMPVAANGSGNSGGPVLVIPTVQPTPVPSDAPTAEPTAAPTVSPTLSPTSNPSASPSNMPSPSPMANLLATIAADGNFSTLSSLLNRPEFADVVNLLNATDTQYTLFAPTDDAFAKLSASDRDALFNDEARLRMYLLYHVVTGELPSTELVKLEHTGTLLANNTIVISTNADGHVLVNDARVTDIDKRSSNGVIHGIDTLLVPPNPSGNPTPTPTPVPSESPSV